MGPSKQGTSIRIQILRKVKDEMNVWETKKSVTKKEKKLETFFSVLEPL